MTHHRSRQRGLTLIELMIAVTLGLLIVAALASLYINSTRSYREDDQYARMLENGRFAMRFLADDLQMADFWGYYMLADDIDDADITVCGVKPYLTVDGSHGSVELITTLSSPCTEGALTGGGLLIRRSGGPPAEGPTTTFADETGRAYLEVRAELREAGYLLGDGGTYTIDAPDAVWQYRSVAYYLDNNRLCRRSFAFNPPQASECLIDGIESWVFQWGIDTDGDSRADEFQVMTPGDATDTEALRGAVSVRICLLMRSANELRNYTNEKVYTLCGVDQNGGAAYSDGRLRRVFERVVELRNASNVIRFRAF